MLGGMASQIEFINNELSCFGQSEVESLNPET